MRLLFVHKSTLGAFGEAAINYFPAKVAAEGHQVSFIASGGGNADFLRSHQVEVYEIDRSQRWLRETHRLIESLKPDLVHVFLHTGCGILPALWRMRQDGPKFVLDIRSPLLRSGFPRLLHRAKNLMEPLFFDAIMTHSIESAWTQLGRRDDMYFLPPGVDFGLVGDAARLAEKNTGISPAKLVYTGSLDRLRNPHLLIEALIQASEKTNLQLDIYGDGSERHALEAYVAGKDKSDVIRFMGLVDRKTLFQKLPEYDLGLAYVPGGMYETAPALKTLEFLACGLPVLATNTYGSRMFVRHGYNGHLAGQDPAAFAHAILEVLETEKLNALRANARASVEQYDWGTITRDKLIPVYMQLLSRTTPHAAE